MVTPQPAHLCGRLYACAGSCCRPAGIGARIGGPGVPSLFEGERLLLVTLLNFIANMLHAMRLWTMRRSRRRMNEIFHHGRGGVHLVMVKHGHMVCRGLRRDDRTGDVIIAYDAIILLFTYHRETVTQRCRWLQLLGFLWVVLLEEVAHEG